MTRLMLDHFRRWRWVLAIAGIFEFVVGWAIAGQPRDPFEFWVLTLSFGAGANLLSIDLSRGVLGPVAGIPLTGRQVGRSWWMATVLLPAIGLTAMLFLGAGAFCGVHPHEALPSRELALASLLSLAWLGSIFQAILGGMRAPDGGPWRKSYNIFLSVISVLIIFGSLLLCQGVFHSPFRCAVLLGIGGFLTIAGWVDAGRFETGRGAQFYRGRFEPPAGWRNRIWLTSLARKMTTNQSRSDIFRLAVHAEINKARKTTASQSQCDLGYGGMPFFIRSQVVRMFSLVAFMSGLIALIWVWGGSAMRHHAAVAMFASPGSFMASAFVIMFQLVPALRHLRVLRTMPVSAVELSLALMAITLLPLMVLGGGAASVAGLVSGIPAAITLLGSYALVLALSSLCVFLAVWLGEGKGNYTLLIAVFACSQVLFQTFLDMTELPLSLTTAIAATCILLALALTTWALKSSRYAYRSRAISPGSYPF